MTDEDRRRFTIRAAEAWVENLPVGKPPSVYYRHAGGGVRLTAGEHIAVLNHKTKTFTIEAP